MVLDKKSTLQIKGIREGLLVSLGEGDWPELQEALLEHIEQQASFFQGAKVALEVGNHILRAADMGVLRDRLADRGVTLWAVTSFSPVTEQTAQILGLATRINTPRPERNIRSLDTTLEGDNAIFVQRTLRSGFRVVSHGHVIVVGDVNPGAEIEAGGNVIVWGRLRGSVHAGADGDKGAIICALEMAPTQLRIAGFAYAAKPTKQKPQPVSARLHDGQIVVEFWAFKDR